MRPMAQWVRKAEVKVREHVRGNKRVRAYTRKDPRVTLYRVVNLEAGENAEGVDVDHAGRFWSKSKSEALRYARGNFALIEAEFDERDFKRATQTSATAYTMPEGAKSLFSQITTPRSFKATKVTTGASPQATSDPMTLERQMERVAGRDLPPQRDDELIWEYQSRILHDIVKDEPELAHEIAFQVREKPATICNFLGEAATRYRQGKGLPEPQVDVRTVRADLSKAGRVVEAIRSAKRDRTKDRAAYDDFKRQNDEMYKILTEDLGVTVEVWDERVHGRNDPYATAEEQAQDLERNRHLWINRGEFFIGENADSPTGTNHPYMSGAEYVRFRAVHDAWGHAAYGTSFDRHGEYQAWLAHNSMYDGPGRQAMSTEYHAVNSHLWYTGTPMPPDRFGIVLPDDVVGQTWGDNGTLVRKSLPRRAAALIAALGLDAESITRMDNLYEEYGHHHLLGAVDASHKLTKADVDVKAYTRNGRQVRAYRRKGRDRKLDTGERDPQGPVELMRGPDEEGPDDEVKVRRVGDGSKERPMLVTTVEDAIAALDEGKHIVLRQEDEVATLLDKMKEIVDDARERGEKKVYDLCKISVPGTNLFCAESKNVPRNLMPQLGGKPEPGSKGDTLPKNEEGGIDITPQFLAYLDQRGIKYHEEEKLASHLRASQNQLEGGKVAGIADAIETGKFKPPSNPIIVTSDNYVLDGHHRWAGYVGANFMIEDAKGGDTELSLPTLVIDMPVWELLPIANNFAKSWGIFPKALGKAVTPCYDCGEGVVAKEFTLAKGYVKGYTRRDGTRVKGYRRADEGKRFASDEGGSINLDEDGQQMMIELARPAMVATAATAPIVLGPVTGGAVALGAIAANAWLDRWDTNRFTAKDLDSELLPPQPGEVEIPKGALRLYHYTRPENMGPILEGGLKRSAAKGETYGEPNVVWASTQKPEDDANYVEFYAFGNEVDIGGPMDGQAFTDEEIERRTKAGSNVTLWGDVPPERITTFNVPWHQTVRYLMDYQDEVLAGQYDWVLEDESLPNEARAVRAIKARVQKEWVRGYTRRDGTRVPGYRRADRDKRHHDDISQEVAIARLTEVGYGANVGGIHLEGWDRFSPAMKRGLLDGFLEQADLAPEVAADIGMIVPHNSHGAWTALWSVGPGEGPRKVAIQEEIDRKGGPGQVTGLNDDQMPDFSKPFGVIMAFPTDSNHSQNQALFDDHYGQAGPLTDVAEQWSAMVAHEFGHAVAYRAIAVATQATYRDQGPAIIGTHSQTGIPDEDFEMHFSMDLARAQNLGRSYAEDPSLGPTIEDVPERSFGPGNPMAQGKLLSRYSLTSPGEYFAEYWARASTQETTQGYPKWLAIAQQFAAYEAELTKVMLLGWHQRTHCFQQHVPIGGGIRKARTEVKGYTDSRGRRVRNYDQNRKDKTARWKREPERIDVPNPTGVRQKKEERLALSPLMRAAGGGGLTLNGLLARTRIRARKLWNETVGRTPDEAIRNIVETFSRANDETVALGEDWYRNANRVAARMAKTAKITTGQAAGIIAALSPQTGWSLNVAQAKILIESMATDRVVTHDDVLAFNRSRMAAYGVAMKEHEAGRRGKPEKPSLLKGDKIEGKKLSQLPADYQAKAIAAFMSSSGEMTDPVEAGDPDKASQRVGANSENSIAKAIAIFNAEPGNETEVIDATLSGFKVRSFYNNIAVPSAPRDVTVDSLAFSMLANDQELNSSSPRYHRFASSGAANRADRSGPNARYGEAGLGIGYAIASDVFRQATQQINEQRKTEGMPSLTPNQVQAITWIQWRQEREEQ